MQTLSAIALIAALILASVLGVGMLIPQTRKIFHTGDLSGVSPEWIGFGLALNSAWLGYGFDNQLWGVIPVSVGALVLYIAMAYGVHHHTTGDLSRLLASTTGLLAALGLTAVLGGASALPIAIGLAYTVQFAPAAIEAVKSVRLTGIATSTWSMALAEAIIWAIYGAHVRDLALVIGGIGASLMATVILTQVLGLTSTSRAVVSNS